MPDVQEAVFSKEFLGANTYNGFCSGYNDFLNDFIYKCDEPFVYVIKGGPGTGKSTFIKKAEKLLKENSFDVGVLRCSGDPESLDGVYSYGAGIMVLDGTAPHCIEVSRAGIDGTILNFGEFWDCQKLLKSREKINLLLQKKKNAYTSAYGFLGAAGKLYDIAEQLVKDIKDDNKITDCIESVIDDVLKYFGTKNGLGKNTKSFATAFTAEGISGCIEEFTGSDFEDYTFFSFEFPDWVSSGKYIDYIGQRIMAAGYNIKTAVCGIDGKTSEHIVVPEIKCAFVSSNEYHTYSTCKPFAKIHIGNLMNCKNCTAGDNDMIHRCRLKYDEMLVKAAQSLKEANVIHKQVENYYVAAMDFEKLNLYSQRVLKEIEKRF